MPPADADGWIRPWNGGTAVARPDGEGWRKPGDAPDQSAATWSIGWAGHIMSPDWLSQ